MLDLLAPLTEKEVSAVSAGIPETSLTAAEQNLAGVNFEWAKLEPEALVVREQRSVAVYRNTVGAVVIRQEGDYSPDDDPFIVLRDDAAVKALIRSLQLEVGGA